MKLEVDKAHKDKASRIFSPDFSVNLTFQHFVTDPSTSTTNGGRLLYTTTNENMPPPPSGRPPLPKGAPILRNLSLQRQANANGLSVPSQPKHEDVSDDEGADDFEFDVGDIESESGSEHPSSVA